MRPSWAASADWQGLGYVFSLLLAVLLVATVQAFALPPVGASDRLEPRLDRRQPRLIQSG